MRSYSVAITSLAIHAPVKWTDNLLSQHKVPNVFTEERGVPRHITPPALLQIALIRQLHAELGMSVAQALRLSAVLLDPASDGRIRMGELSLSIDLSQFRRQLDVQLAAAIESAPRPQRGRPPSSQRSPR